MEDAHRFLRYINPGALFVGETVALLYLFFPVWMSDALGGLKQDTGLGLAVVGLVATGSIGLLLSTVHHALFNRTRGTVLDYSALIGRLRSEGLLEIVVPAGSPGATDVSRLDSWVIVTSLWSQLQKLSPRIEGAESKARRLADLTHSMGTASVGSVAAWALAAVIACFVGEVSRAFADVIRAFLAHVVAVGVTCVLYINYRNTARICQGVVEQSLTDALADLRVQLGKPVATHVCLGRRDSEDRRWLQKLKRPVLSEPTPQGQGAAQQGAAADGAKGGERRG